MKPFDVMALYLRVAESSYDLALCLAQVDEVLARGWIEPWEAVYLNNIGRAIFRGESA